MNLTWETVKDAVASFGWVKGTFTLFFWMAHIWIFRIYNGRLSDRQKEIDRLAADNHEYRDRFLSVLDKHFGLEPKPEQESLPKQEEPPIKLPEPRKDAKKELPKNIPPKKKKKE